MAPRETGRQNEVEEDTEAGIRGVAQPRHIPESS